MLNDPSMGEPTQRQIAHIAHATTYEHIERLPLSWNEIGITLLRAYVALPLVLVGPFVLLVGALSLAHKTGLDRIARADTVFPAVFTVVGLLIMVNFIWQCLLALRAGRGWHPDALAQVDPIRSCIRRLSFRRVKQT